LFHYFIYYPASLYFRLILE